MSEPRSHRPKVFLACESTVAGKGGIGRVARLIARVLGEERSRGVLEADGLALSDPEPARDLGMAMETSRSSRPRYVYRVQRAALTHTHFIYDNLGMARAHGRLPFLRRPFMTFIYGIEVWEGTRRNRIRTARRSDFMISISRYARKRAQRAHGVFSGARVCWLGTEADELPTSARDLTGPPSVMILGRIVEGRDKGHGELVRCWPSVVAAVPDARLVVVGQGSGLEALRLQAAASPVSAHIDLRGFVPEDRIESVWGEATAFAMPSRGEGFGLVYVEAMRHGLPVIASLHDAAPEVNVNGETGYNVDLERPGELADRIIRILRDRDLADRLGRAGRTRWMEHFRFSSFRDRFLPLLGEFLGSDRPQG